MLPNDPIKTNLDPIFTGQKPVDKTVPASAYNTLTNQEYVPSQPTIRPAPLPEKNLKPTNKSLVRTYKSDVESAIKNDHVSSINIAMAENEKMRKKIEGEATKITPSEYSKNKIIIFISLALVFVGVIGLIIVLIVKNQSSVPVAQVQEMPALITAEYKDELNTDVIVKGNFNRALSSRLNDIQIAVNNFYSPYITTGATSTKRLITASEFVTLAGFKIPDVVKRNLQPDFMVGMYAFSQNLPFIIFKTSSFENTYAGMLDWEKDLENDLQVIFRLPGYENNGGLLNALNPTTQRKFEDKVIVNKDVRLIHGIDGKTELLYSILDKDTIIITVNDVAFKEIVNRLNKEKGLKR